MSRRLPLATVLAIAAALVFAPGSGAQAPTQDSVTGTASSGFGRGELFFTFDAHSGPSGENPTGTVTIESDIADLGPQPVSCLGVSGNRATVVVSFPTAPPANAGAVIQVQDNGTSPDAVSASFVLTLPSSCAAPGSVTGASNSGDLTVVDAEPLPASTDQCKNGGWRNFPGFKNQGQCIRFVRHKARQKCIFERAAHGRAAFITKYGQGPHKRRAMRSCVLLRMTG